MAKHAILEVSSGAFFSQLLPRDDACAQGSQGSPHHLAAPLHALTMEDQPSHVRLQTTQGSITLELYWKHAPATCKNFAQLASRGYYNGTLFHRM